jgi:hypothetical protein
MSLSEGLNWINTKTKKITEVLLTSSPYKTKDDIEGYSGMLGMSAIDTINTNETANTTSLTTSFQSKLNTYAAANQRLQQKTNTFLNTTKNTEGRNYNIFINKTVDYGDIKPTINEVKCASSDILSGGGLNDAGTAFDNAYPNNFNNVNDANNACKLWAADGGMTHYAIGKNANNTKFKCYVGSLTGTPKQYSVPQVAYIVASSTDATNGGLFYDGTIGVYNNNASSPNSYNIQLMQGLGVPNGYSMCDKFAGGSIYTPSIQATLGANCSGLTQPPFNARYITIFANPNKSNVYIHFSQLAVYVYDATNGNITNVASKGTVDNGSGNSSWGNRSPPEKAIDGNLSNRAFPNIYHAPTTKTSEYWQLDLQQEYPVFQVVYYNRGDGYQASADGMSLVLENAPRTQEVICTLNNNMIQTFNISNTDSQTEPPPPRLTVRKISGPSSFINMGTDRNSGTGSDVNFWRPIIRQDRIAGSLFPVGDVLQVTNGAGYTATPESVIVGGDVKEPLSYSPQIGTACLSCYNKIGQKSFTCPDGYVNMGLVATTNGIPNPTNIKCVPLDCVIPASSQSVQNVWSGGKDGLPAHNKLSDPTKVAYSYNLFSVPGDGKLNFYEFKSNSKCSINFES